MWHQSGITFNLAATGVLVFADVTPTPLAPEDPEDEGHGNAVVIRSIANFSLRNVGTDAAVHNMGVGMYVSTKTALDNLSFVDPLVGTSLNQDWYYWSARSLLKNDFAQEGKDWDIDIRSSRKLRNGYRLLIVAVADVANTDPLILTVGMRNLWRIQN